MRLPKVLRRTVNPIPRKSAPLAGQFQPYNFTQADRYPWLFKFAAGELESVIAPRLLSFGCSWGEEVWALQRYVPGASIKGMDVEPRNIELCRRRAVDMRYVAADFVQAADTRDEPSASYDAVFCLAVLCLGDLTVAQAPVCTPRLKFVDFERTVTDFARCLKPGGLLALHTCNFRFSDTAVSAEFAPILQAQLSELAADVVYDADNRLLPGVRYHDVLFRKRGA